ncbi:AnfO protein, required for Mo- and V-independent nitrogenase [Desulfocucumis palustris]|uniref:AnfO protein, required for Mo-and V-independent nitrogenase n=1 Tax=Desulfocucumis palustris TaxID=1898651 RepID=A0A2L2XLJ5_9FIRM|nr:Fe-only nitrogenase accessory AnfO family protein [Desulfocucumis palustris]GBF35166.1 AnfO protein, required for Mo- and V-independent nitrogenase [Desulfocucumis palustris]
MLKEIAVHVGRNGETATLYEQGKIVIYQRKQGSWNVHREKDYSFKREQGLPGMRKQMGEVVDFIGGCKIFVAGAISGIPYYELEKAGCSIWEFSGEPDDLLEYVWEKEEQAALEKAVRLVAVPGPVDMGNGCYSISIKEIQEAGTGITTKQVLLPFLRQGDFYRLEVLCNHIPPWLKMEIMGSGLTCEVEKVATGEVRLVIGKKVCSA